MPRENPAGNLPFKLQIDVHLRGYVGPRRIGGFRHIKSQNFGRSSSWHRGQVPSGPIAGRALPTIPSGNDASFPSGIVVRVHWLRVAKMITAGRIVVREFANRSLYTII